MSNLSSDTSIPVSAIRVAAEKTAKTVAADVGPAVTPIGTAGTIAPFAYRTSAATTPSMLMLLRSVVP